MSIEYEATFPDIAKDLVRANLEMAGARLVKKEFLQKRSVFHLPGGVEIDKAWLRVRDEGDRVTMSYKHLDESKGFKIENQKEILLIVNDFDAAENFLLTIGAEKKSYQENKREIWELDGVEIDIDEWPFLEPFVEVEGLSEEDVRLACSKAGFDYQEAMFCSVDTLYSQKYGIKKDTINNHTPEITFENNPFEKK
jgi:adenylate cyclase class 2